MSSVSPLTNQDWLQSFNPCQVDLENVTLLKHAVGKFPPSLKEPWSLHTVRYNLQYPILLNFIYLLKVKADSRAITSKAKTEETFQTKKNVCIEL